MTVSTNYRTSKVLQAFESGDDEATLSEINSVRRENIRAVVAQIPESSVPAFIKFIQRNQPVLKSKFPHYHTWSVWMLKCHHNIVKSLPRAERESLTRQWRLTLEQKKQVLKCCNSIIKLRAQNNFFQRQLELRKQQKEASHVSATAAAAGPKRRGLLFAANDASSDEEEFFGASTVGASESDDNWDELSEIKFGANEEEEEEEGGEDGEQAPSSERKSRQLVRSDEAETIVVEDSD